MDQVKGLSFGAALSYLWQGKRVRRVGWNGKGMYITLKPGYPEGVEVNKATSESHKIPTGSIVRIRPYIEMMDAQGFIVPGWLASQADILSDDWEVV